MKFTLLLLVFMLLQSTVLFGSELIVHHVKPESIQDIRHQYYVDVLNLVLNKTKDTDGPFRLSISKKEMLQARALESLATGQDIDVVWTMTSKEREARYRPIRIPLMKGLLGYRIFIIRRKDEPLFAKVKTLAGLKLFTAGQESDWPDTSILRANGLRVIEGINYQGLFSMLESHRFDYFPRGLNEPWVEVKIHKEKNLIVEKTLAIQYPAPIYFFVNNKNTKLADRLERGLRMAISDGSFNTLFRHHPSNIEIFELVNLSKRRLFRLKNPFLTPETPLNDKKLWYFPLSNSNFSPAE